MLLVINWLKNNWSTLLVFIVVLSVSLWLKGQFDESKLEEAKEKYVEELSAQRKAHDQEVAQINKVNTESL
jgi:predicted tellurium resistance membrane protein TerC